MRQRKRHLLVSGLQKLPHRDKGPDCWKTLCGLVLACRYDMIWVQERWPYDPKSDRNTQAKIMWELNHSLGSGCPWRMQTDEGLRSMMRATCEPNNWTSPVDKCPPRSDEYEVFYEYGSWDRPILVQSGPRVSMQSICSRCEDAHLKGAKVAWPQRDLDHDVVPAFREDHVYCTEECGVHDFEELCGT